MQLTQKLSLWRFVESLRYHCHQGFLVNFSLPFHGSYRHSLKSTCTTPGVSIIRASSVVLWMWMVVLTVGKGGRCLYYSSWICISPSPWTPLVPHMCRGRWEHILPWYPRYPRPVLKWVELPAPVVLHWLSPESCKGQITEGALASSFTAIPSSCLQ